MADNNAAQIKAMLESAIQAVVNAQNAMADAQAALTKAQVTLRKVADTPPGQVPSVGEGG